MSSDCIISRVVKTRRGICSVISRLMHLVFPFRVVCQSCVFDVIQPLLVTKSSKPFSKTCCVSHSVFGAEGPVWRKVGKVLACVEY